MHRFYLLSLALFACKTENNLVEETYKEPTLELLDPAVAAWTHDGDHAARVRAEHLTDVTVSGAAVDGDSAEISLVRGVNLVEASGTDMRGDKRFVRNGVLAGEFAEPVGAIERAGQVRVNQGGLDVICDTAEPMLSVYEIVGLIPSPVYTYTYDLIGYDIVTAYVYIDEIWYDQPELKADPRTGVLDVEATIPNLYVKIYVWADIAGLFDVDTTAIATADQVDMTLPLTVDARGGRLHVGMEEPTTIIDNFWFDLEAIPWELEGDLLGGWVEGYLEDTIPGMIAEMVPPIVEEQLAGLNLSFSTTVMDKAVDIAASFSYADVDNDGIVADVDLDVDMPGSGNLPYEGYLTAASFGLDPDPSLRADVSMSLYDDLLNRVMFEAWQAGLLEMTMSSADGSLSPLMLLPLKATQGEITISGLLPPVVVQNEAGELEAQIGELMLTVDTPDGQLGHHLVASVVAYVPLEVSAEEGVLSLALGEPDFHITVRESDWGADDETVTQMLEEMIPVDTLLGMLGDFDFPLPSLAGVTIASAEAERESEAFTGITVDLR